MLGQIALAANLIFTPAECSLSNLSQLPSSDPQTTRVYLIRHGESAFNVADANGIKMNSGIGLTVPLTDKGKSQAVEAGQLLNGKLQSEGAYVIVSSTALRAQQTADLIFEQLSMTHVVSRGGNFDGFCELGLGKWEGQPKNDVYEEALKEWEHMSAKDKFTYPKVSTGESFAEVAERGYADLERVIKENPGKTIIIATHYQAMNALFLKFNTDVDTYSIEPATPLPSLAFDNCDLVKIEWENGTPLPEAKITQHIHTFK